MHIRFLPLIAGAVLFAATPVFSQDYAIDPFLSADEINSMTLSADDYEEKYYEQFETDENLDDPNYREEVCGLASGTPAASDFITGLLGPWTMSHLAGFVTVGGMTLPYPADDKADRVMFERVENSLIMTHVDMDSPMRLLWPRETDWTFGTDIASGKPAPGLSSEDLELAMNCEIKEMPRLIGHSTIRIDGAVFNFTYRLMVLGSNNIHAIMHVNGAMGGHVFFSARSVTLQR